MKISKESFDFARDHIKNFFDSDFYPKLVEFEALFARWDEVIEFRMCKNNCAGFF